MADIEIKRGYEVLPDNNVRFGVRVINNSDSAVSDVEVILDYTESFFEIEGDKIGTLVKDSVVQRSTIGASGRKCPNCSREVEANEKFCLECGAKL